MANATQVIPGFWKLTLGSVNSYLLETEDGLLVIDSGYPKKRICFLQQLRKPDTTPKLFGILSLRTDMYINRARIAFIDIDESSIFGTFVSQLSKTQKLF